MVYSGGRIIDRTMPKKILKWDSISVLRKEPENLSTHEFTREFTREFTL